MPTFPGALRPFGIGLLAVALVGCGGGSSRSQAASSTTAQALTYTDPASAGYRLVRDAASTSTHLVLGLVGPSGDQIRGGVFTLNADASRATWGSAGGSDAYLKEGSVLALGTGTRLLKSTVNGEALSAGIYQKGAATAATLGAEPILSVALDLKVGAAKGAVALASGTSQILDAAGKTQTVTVALGTLQAE